jgi:hypothetical protein
MIGKSILRERGMETRRVASEKEEEQVRKRLEDLGYL